MCSGSVNPLPFLFSPSLSAEQHFANTLALTVPFPVNRTQSMVWAYFGAKKIDILCGRTNYSPLHLALSIDVVVHIYFEVYKASQLMLSYISTADDLR